jgi:hypothetical protein
MMLRKRRDARQAIFFDLDPVASQQPYLPKFFLNDIFVEGFHDVFVSPPLQRPSNVRHIVLGGAKHHFGPVAAGKLPQCTQEVIAVHFRHIPIEQNRIRQLVLARGKRLLAVLGLAYPETETL